MNLNVVKKFSTGLLFLLGVMNFALAESESSVLLSESLSAGKVYAVTNFKINQFVGNWYELARIPVSFENRCQAPIVFNYTLKDKEIAVVRNCATVSGIPQVNDGIIYLNNSNFIGDGSLIVSQIPTWLRWTHFGRNEVAVIYLNDEYLMMGTPDQKHLWIFAHNENPPLAKIQNLIEIAKYQGFSISKLIFNYPAYYAK